MLQPIVALALLLPVGSLSRPVQDDVADVPIRELRAGEVQEMRYFLIGAEEDAEAPKQGFRLLLVMPGGDGSADFRSFVQRIWKHVLSERYLIAQLVAPQWSEEQAEKLVWPTARNPWPKAEFTTETFLQEVIADVEERHELDLEHVYTLSWSSSGPAAYAYSLTKGTRVTGSFVAMSVFKPDQLPKLSAAKGQAYYLLHSPDDFIPIRMAEDARKKLAKARAEVVLQTYEGGHGWHGDVFGMLREGLAWLEGHHAKAAKRPKKKKRR